MNTFAVGLNALQEMPPPKEANFQVFDKGREDRFYLTQFMQQFGAAYDEQAVIDAPTKAHELLISDLLFTDHKTGKSKLNKRDRSQYVLYIADNILNPQEILIEEGGFGGSHLYFLSRYLIKKEILNVLAIFKQTGKIWSDWSGYQTFDCNYFKSKRVDGKLIYRDKK